MNLYIKFGLLMDRKLNIVPVMRGISGLLRKLRYLFDNQPSEYIRRQVSSNCEKNIVIMTFALRKSSNLLQFFSVCLCMVYSEMCFCGCYWGSKIVNY